MSAWLSLDLVLPIGSIIQSTQRRRALHWTHIKGNANGFNKQQREKFQRYLSSIRIPSWVNLTRKTI
eukprot:69245-Rhodomonas_salina.3